MKHIDENILELYLLGSEKLTDRKDEIQAHLAECNDCKELFEEMREFYVYVDNKSLRISASRELTGSSLVVNPEYREYIQNKESPASITQKVFYLIAQNPVKLGLSFAAALVTFFIMLNKNPVVADTNPYRIESSDYMKKIIVYNRENKELWTQNWERSLFIDGQEAEYYISKSLVTDLNSDGGNEVTSIIPTLSGSDKENILKIFKKNGDILKQITVGRSTNYGKRVYESGLLSNWAVLINDYDGDGKKEIIVATHHRNSPFVISRFDNKGNLLGEYWHYGHFWGMYDFDLNSDGKTEILLTGINDDTEEAAIVVLDPAKINGNKSSRITNQFDMEETDAEVKYLKVSKTIFDNAVNSKPRFNFKIQDSDSLFTIVYSTLSLRQAENLISLDFKFDTSLNLLQVIPIDQTIRLIIKLSEQGKFSKEEVSNLAQIYKSHITSLIH